MKRLAAALAVSLAFAVAAGAQAQTYPDKPIRLVVPFPAGSGTDIVGRLLGQSIEDPATVLRTLALFGQVTIFCNNAVRRVLRFKILKEARIAAIQALVRSQTKAIMHDAMTAKRARKTGRRA